MDVKRSLSPEFLQVRLVGAAEATDAVVSVNGQVQADALGRPIMVAPGVHTVALTGFAPKTVEIDGGSTDIDAPLIVTFAHPADAAG